MDDLHIRIQVLERGHDVHTERIDQLEAADQRFGSLVKWSLPLAVTVFCALLAFWAAEVRSLSREVRVLVGIAARIDERLNNTERRVNRIEGIDLSVAPATTPDNP